MANMFNSDAGNYIVSVAAIIAKLEKKIVSEKDSKSLVLLHNKVTEACKILNETYGEYMENGKINE